jgi:hypothetical protein
MEDVERAQLHEMEQRSEAIARRLPVPTPGQGSDTCKRCEGSVPKARAALGYCVCVECQTRIERKYR